MQLVDHVVFPPSLQMEMENRPKFALTRLMTVPSSHSISRVDPSHPYLVRRSEPAMTSELILESRFGFTQFKTKQNKTSITLK